MCVKAWRWETVWRLKKQREQGEGGGFVGSRVGAIPCVTVTEERNKMEKAGTVGSHWRHAYSRERPEADTEAG